MKMGPNRRSNFWKLSVRLVAIAPSSDFVLPHNSIPRRGLDFLCKAGLSLYAFLAAEKRFSGELTEVNSPLWSGPRKRLS